MKFACVLLFIALMISCKSGQKQDFDSSVGDEISRRAQLDREILDSLSELELAGAVSEELEYKKDSILTANYQFAKNIFDTYGFPGISQVGEQCSNDYWLLVQHSDMDVSFQEMVSNEFGNQVAKNNASSQNMAYLIDRVLVNKGEPQIYGTQVVFDTLGNPTPKKLKDLQLVDTLRRSVGLDPLENYLQLMKATRAKPGEKIEITIKLPQP